MSKKRNMNWRKFIVGMITKIQAVDANFKRQVEMSLHFFGKTLRCIYVTIFWQFFNYRKTWFHINGVNNYFIILCIFPNISVWRQSIFFPSFFWNQNRLGFKTILEIKLSDKSIVSKKGWKRNKGKPTSQFS